MEDHWLFGISVLVDYRGISQIHVPIVNNKEIKVKGTFVQLIKRKFFSGGGYTLTVEVRQDECKELVHIDSLYEECIRAHNTLKKFPIFRRQGVSDKLILSIQMNNNVENILRKLKKFDQVLLTLKFPRLTIIKNQSFLSPEIIRLEKIVQST